jgi:hypothetical protein
MTQSQAFFRPSGKKHLPCRILPAPQNSLPPVHPPYLSQKIPRNQKFFLPMPKKRIINTPDVFNPDFPSIGGLNDSLEFYRPALRKGAV